MYRSLVVLLLVWAAALGAPRTRLVRSGRIINGAVVDISDYPWQLELQLFGEHQCGASIISDSWALTAAHCIEQRETSSITVRAGTSIRESGGTVLNVSRGLIHEDYETFMHVNDIAVLQVDGAFPLGQNAQPVTLPAAGYAPPTGTIVTVSGWGRTVAGGEMSDDLRAVDLAVFDLAICQDMYALLGSVTERNVCVGLEDRGVCQGDSGGPLVQAGVQVGIVSWGMPGCNALVNVYTNVGAQREWIAATTGV